MKKLILISGTMGVGKTAVSRELLETLPNAVFLDGDWCWMMRPFRVNDETKTMVMKNIVFMLNQFLHCSAYEHIIFCWVMHQQAILDELLSKLDTEDCQVFNFSLVATPEALTRRVLADPNRTQADLERTLPRIPLYSALDTAKIDVSDISPAQAAQTIAKILG